MALKGIESCDYVKNDWIFFFPAVSDYFLTVLTVYGNLCTLDTIEKHGSENS